MIIRFHYSKEYYFPYQLLCFFQLHHTLSLPESVVIKGASETVDFHKYALKLKTSQVLYNKIGEQLKATEDSLAKVNLQEQAKAIYKSVNVTRDSLIDAYPASMLSIFLSGIKTPEYVVDESIPDSLRPMHRYLFEKEHFLDNLDFSDARTLRTSYLPSTIDNYINTRLFQWKEVEQMTNALEWCLIIV